MKCLANAKKPVFLSAIVKHHEILWIWKTVHSMIVSLESLEGSRTHSASGVEAPQDTQLGSAWAVVISALTVHRLLLQWQQGPSFPLG